jgi:hypothetical protein
MDHRRQPPQELILVQETPIDQDYHNPDQDPEETYEATQYPDECRRTYAFDDEEPSVLVRETPLSAYAFGNGMHDSL